MTEFDALQEYKESISRRGGEATKAKYGTNHYRRMGRLSAAKRKADARRRMIDLTRPLETGIDPEAFRQMVEGMNQEDDD